MKKLFTILTLAIVLVSCKVAKDIQVKEEVFILVKIDPITHRDDDGNTVRKLIWKDKHGTEFTSYCKHIEYHKHRVGQATTYLITR
jgi:hypothetical protein